MSHDAFARNWKRDVGIAVGAGLAAAVITGLGSFTVGRVTGSEARLLLEAVIPTSRSLCAAIITATATVLALMLTLLSLVMLYAALRDLIETVGLSKESDG